MMNKSMSNYYFPIYYSSVSLANIKSYMSSACKLHFVIEEIIEKHERKCNLTVQT